MKWSQWRASLFYSNAKIQKTGSKPVLVFVSVWFDFQFGRKKTFRISVDGLFRFGFDHKKIAIIFDFVLIPRYQKLSLVPERVTLQKRSTGTPFRSLPAGQYHCMVDSGYQLIICETLIINLSNFVIY